MATVTSDLSHVEAASHDATVAHHFESAEQQLAADKLGMWLFLCSELLFFSGLFVTYAIYRRLHPEIFVEGHHHLSKTLGALNTVVLLLSSLTMAWAVRCAQKGQQRGLSACLIATLVCATFFLGVKGFEYHEKWSHGLLWAGSYAPHALSAAHGEGDGTVVQAGMMETVAHPPVGVFFSIYFAMTGVHALHIVGGIIAISWLLWRARRGDFGPRYFGPVECVGLYWHLVDVVWIYLFPLLYLIH